MSEIADILERAADRLSKPGAWTQGAFAGAGDGGGARADDSDAVCWCIMGAIEAEGAHWNGAATRAVERLVHDTAGSWNDAPERTQAEVVAKLREAATLARKQTTNGPGGIGRGG
jgi:hypothetical protein